MIPVNDLARLEEAPSQYVVAGSGKTATDAVHLAAGPTASTPTRSAGCARVTRG